MPEHMPVYGIETEYTCMITFPGNRTYEMVGSCHAVDEALGLYYEPKGKGFDHITSDKITEALEAQGIFRNHHGMLSNGGRFYTDPSGPEYDTPETTTAEEAVLRTFDGDAITTGIFRYLQEQEIIEGFQINRRIVDHNRSSRGIHLNTATSLYEEPNEFTTNLLATLNVVKGAIFGSGGLLLDKQGETEFHHSPRLSLTNNLAEHYSNYSARPLVRIPFKEDRGEYDPISRRIETVTSDALNFGWPLRASLVVTSALVRLIEQAHANGIPLLSNPVNSAHVVGRYGNKQLVNASDEDHDFMQLYPLDVIRTICESALKADEEHGYLDQEAKQVLPEIIEVADKMSQDVSSVANQVESVARSITMQKKIDKDGLTLGSEKMCRFDYAWDWVGGGIAETLRNKRGAGWHGFSKVPSVLAAQKRRVTAPQDTRAGLRGKQIAEHHGQENSTWSRISSPYGELYVEPLDTDYEEAVAGLKQILGKFIDDEDYMFDDDYDRGE